MKLERAFLMLLSTALLVACGDDSEGTDNPGADASGDDTGGSQADVGGEDDTAEPERCVYPNPDDRLELGAVMPDLIWLEAYRPDGEGGFEEFAFDLYDFYCSDDYADYTTLNVVVSAGWCPNCPGFIQYIDALEPQLREEGGLLLFLEAVDTNNNPIGSAAANNYFSQHATTNDSGIRVGDADGEPANAVTTSGLVEFFPTSFVVRRSDMTIIADQRNSDYYLPFVEIAMDPDADWSSPPPPEILPEIPTNCGPEDEESFEPNNSPDDAGEISDITGSFNGGICDSQPDYYRVNIAGDWRLTMEFDGDEGDLDVYVLTEDGSQILTDDEGNPVGSYGYEGLETFDFSGIHSIMVVGYQNATTTYSLFVEPL